MKKISIVLLIILFTSFCEEKKPNFLAREDYSYLKKQNKTLLVIRVLVNTDDSPVDQTPENIINNAIYDNITKFAINYRTIFIKELNKHDKKKKIIIYDKKNGNNYLQYINKSYPKNLANNFDLILEVDIFILLYYDYSHHVHAIKREKLRLIDVNGKVYLSSFLNETLKSIGEKVILRQNKNNLLKALQNIVNKNITQKIKYILNTEHKPNKDNITPLPPSLEKDNLSKD